MMLVDVSTCTAFHIYCSYVFWSRFASGAVLITHFPGSWLHAGNHFLFASFDYRNQHWCHYWLDCPPQLKTKDRIPLMMSKCRQKLFWMSASVPIPFKHWIRYSDNIYMWFSDYLRLTEERRRACVTRQDFCTSENWKEIETKDADYRCSKLCPSYHQ